MIFFFWPLYSPALGGGGRGGGGGGLLRGVVSLPVWEQLQVRSSDLSVLRPAELRVSGETSATFTVRKTVKVQMMWEEGRGPPPSSSCSSLPHMLNSQMEWKTPRSIAAPFPTPPLSSCFAPGLQCGNGPQEKKNSHQNKQKTRPEPRAGGPEECSRVCR